MSWRWGALAIILAAVLVIPQAAMGRQHRKTHRHSQAARVAIAREINSHLTKTPLRGYGWAFEAAGHRWNVSPYLVVAISGEESSFGAHLCGHNPFGWSGIDKNGHRTYCVFSSFEEAISTVTKGLRQNYLDDGLLSVSAVAGRYDPGNSYIWSRNVTSFMYGLGSSSDSVVYPQQ